MLCVLSLLQLRMALIMRTEICRSCFLRDLFNAIHNLSAFLYASFGYTTTSMYS